MSSSIQSGFKIEECNPGHDRLVVRPYSPLFKKPIQEYPCYNITLSKLNPATDLQIQLGTMFVPIVQSILLQESGGVDGIANALKDIVGQTVSVDVPQPVPATTYDGVIPPNIDFVA